VRPRRKAVCAYVLHIRIPKKLDTVVCEAGEISVALPSPPTGGTPGVCNSYVPSDSVFNRFIYAVQFFTLNGLYVILDNQLNFDTTVLTSQTAWVQVSIGPRTTVACAALLEDLSNTLNVHDRRVGSVWRPPSTPTQSRRIASCMTY